MVSTEELIDVIKVVKRNRKKVDFDGTKVALAIKKGFDSIILDDEPVYTSKDVQKVYQHVINKINKEYKGSEKIKVEQIQDLIEESLNKCGYEDVYKSFKEYRERRNQSRELFADEKRMHKFLKTLEGLGLKSAAEEDAKRENANIDGNSAMGTMLHFGSSISKDFATAYLMKKKYADAHADGDIHIHDMDFLAMGTTTCTQIDIYKLFKNGFDTGHGHLREPQDIRSYSALAAIAIQANQNDQHGGQSIPAFDYYMAPGVLKTFKKQYKAAIHEITMFVGFERFLNVNKIHEKIDRLDSIVFDISYMDECAKESEEVKRAFKTAYDIVLMYVKIPKFLAPYNFKGMEKLLKNYIDEGKLGKSSGEGFYKY